MMRVRIINTNSEDILTASSLDYLPRIGEKIFIDDKLYRILDIFHFIKTEDAEIYAEIHVLES